MRIDVSIEDAATPSLRALAAAMADRKPLHAALGKRAETDLRAHFAAREREPNRRNWPKQHLWARIRTATAMVSADSSGATVAIAHPAMAQKVYGGTITPKEGKYLTLPAIAAAYGRSPLAVDGLEVFWGRDGGETRPRALGKEGTVWYWLVRSVTQDPDPDALPPRAAFARGLADEAGEFFARAARRKGGA